MKKNSFLTPCEYTAPEIRVARFEVRSGLCVSPNDLPPVEEEDAGIGEWGN